MCGGGGNPFKSIGNAVAKAVGEAINVVGGAVNSVSGAVGGSTNVIKTPKKAEAEAKQTAQNARAQMAQQQAQA